ncbi:MAG TPA: SDR family NAD(P)-dependent oxidoreductase [Acidimicrobiales bacterium]|jgi:NAD(P)-dependent dehydrogenase (short-subunit alcohol dehydrogenase family)|nr:SDR family NAD(P)-dependent oxidoreductase [Acidimicrobiales bacterium]
MGLLDGHQALVTGAGSGIGRATCLRLHADGATVAVLDIDGETAAAVAAELGGAPVVVADVCDGAAMEAAVKQAVAELGGLTILVNNAGVGAVKPMHRYSDNAYSRIVDVSMKGTFNGIRAAAPVMLEGGRGSIVNMASISGMRPTRGEAPYAAAKAAVIALTQSAALEYGPTLRVNCVSPGLIETPLTAPLMSDEKVRAGFDRKTPLGRVGTAEDVASVIAFLCSDMAAYVTGINLPVDGGSLLPSSQVEGVLTAILSLSD